MEGGIPKGTTVGSYVIDAPIGRGGMGVVYRAYHPRLQRWAAIKMLPPFVGGEDARDRFEREARAVARLRHRHVLTVFDFGEFAGQPYMAVEYMPNGSLQERMPPGPVSVAEALTLLRPLAQALDYAHAQGVLHRDVKPANVFLDGELQPVLADFGLAKLYTEESLTATGLVSGTPTHISPEQANGKPLTGAADQYALGIIAYQLLAGRLPFTGALMELLYAHVNTPPEPPSRLNPSLNPLVDSAILRTLAKDAGERYSTCTEMVGALEAAAAGRVDERRPAAGPRPVELPGATVAMPMAPPAPPAAPGRTRRWGWALVIGVVVLALASVGAIAASQAGGGGRVLATPTPQASPETPTPARRTLTASVSPGGPVSRGESITVAGGGFAPGTTVQAGFYTTRGIAPISQLDTIVGADGAYRQTGIVPPEAPSGEDTLVVCRPRETDLSRCARTVVTVR